MAVTVGSWWSHWERTEGRLRELMVARNQHAREVRARSATEGGKASLAIQCSRIYPARGAPWGSAGRWQSY